MNNMDLQDTVISVHGLTKVYGRVMNRLWTTLVLICIEVSLFTLLVQLVQVKQHFSIS